MLVFFICVHLNTLDGYTPWVIAVYENCFWKWHECFFKNVWDQHEYYISKNLPLTFLSAHLQYFSCSSSQISQFVTDPINFIIYIQNNSGIIWSFFLCHLHCCQLQTSDTFCCLFLWSLVSRLGDGCLWI